MASPSATNVVAGKPVATGGVLAAPLGTALPADTSTTPNAAFKGLGYVSEDGVKKSENRDSSEIKEWGGLTVKKSQTGFEATFQFQLLEYLNPDGAKAVYGDSAVTVTAASASHGAQMSVAVNGSAAPHKAWIFDMFDGLAKVRIAIPDGQITDVGDTSFDASDGAVRDVTITCYPVAGVLYTELTDDGLVTP
jgi:hypothetical protein